MKNFKRNMAVLGIVSMLSVSSVTALAAGAQTPADAAASLTGRDVEDVIRERMETGKTFGAIAAEAGKLEEFKQKILEAREQILSEDVEKGVITQEEADDIIEAVKERQALCDGTGYGYGCGRGGYGYGCGYGGAGYSRGYGRGMGGGWGRRNGSCLYYGN